MQILGVKMSRTEEQIRNEIISQFCMIAIRSKRIDLWSTEKQLLLNVFPKHFNEEELNEMIKEEIKSLF